MAGLLLPSLLVTSSFAQFRRTLFDDTFAGIHQLAWFDWALLIPYFTVLIVLSVYGLHRFETIHTYFKHRRNARGRPPSRFEQLPRVTIQLPLYNERYVLERLIDETVKIEYPRELLQIQVLDDSTDDTPRFRRSALRALPRHRASHRVPPSHQPPWLQSRRAAGRTEDRHRRIRRRFRRRFHPAARLPDPHHPSFRRPANRRRADPLELSQPRFQFPHRSRSSAARRPLRSRAWRALARGTFLQLQRHGRPAAREDDRRCRRLAARHAHRGFRPQLPRAD